MEMGVRDGVVIAVEVSCNVRMHWCNSYQSSDPAKWIWI